MSEQKQAQLAELAQQVGHAHVEFGSLLAATAARGVQIGRLALEAKKLAGHGHFAAWKASLRDQYGVSDRSLERYMYLAKHHRQLLSSLQPESVSDAASEDQSAETLLRGLKIQDALQLLKTSPRNRKERPSRSAQSISKSPQAVFVPAQVMEIASELFGQVDFIVTDTAREFSERLSAPSMTVADAVAPASSWQGQAVVHADADHLQSLIDRITQEMNDGRLRAALLLAPAITDAPSLVGLQAYPRAFFRERLKFINDSGLLVVAEMPHLLVFICNDDRVMDFALAAGGHTDIFVAYHL